MLAEVGFLFLIMYGECIKRERCSFLRLSERL